MKTTKIIEPTTMAAAYKLLLAGLLTAVGVILLPAIGRADEVFPSLTIDGHVRTNVSVIRADPVEVMLRWPGGGCTCKRQDLPTELAVHYPYEPDKAAQWAREKAAQRVELERRSAEQQRARVLENFHRKEASLKAQIKTLDNELHTLNDVISVLANKAKGTRRNSPQHTELNQARDRKIELLTQLHKLQAELRATHEQISRFR
jgi:hypothetical protein